MEPIYTPLPRSKERGLKDLIRMEWDIIDELRDEAKKAKHEKHRAQYYLALSSHARTLSALIRDAGVITEDAQDLAVLLKDIAKKAHILFRNL